MARWGLVAAHGATTHGYYDFEPQRACVTARESAGKRLRRLSARPGTATTAGQAPGHGEAAAGQENLRFFSVKNDRR
jgi:hypothetical protein